MDATQRRSHILAQLDSLGRVAVDEVATELETSVITVRRDLEQLAAEGAVRRVRGGAVSTSLRGGGVPFAARVDQEDEVKAKIAERVASLIDDGEAVVVDSGTTGVATARALAGRRVTIMPMSVQALTALEDSRSVSLMVPGGTVNPVEGSIVGPLVEQTLSSLRFDTAVLTCCGADPESGVTAYNLPDAAAKRAIVGSANRTILFAESAKFAKSAMAIVCGMDRVDIVVTDSGIAPATAEALEEAGVRLVIAS